MSELKLIFKRVEDEIPDFEKEIIVKWKYPKSKHYQISIGYLESIDKRGNNWFVYNHTSNNPKIEEWCNMPNIL